MFIGFYVISIPAALALAFSEDGLVRGVVGMWVGIDIGYCAVALALLVRRRCGAAHAASTGLTLQRRVSAAVLRCWWHGRIGSWR